MREYRESNPACAFCNNSRKRKPKHVHHLEPISYAPEKAADPDNFETLCGKSCHIVVGHGGNWKNYVRNCKELCRQVTLVIRAS